MYSQFGAAYSTSSTVCKLSAHSASNNMGPETANMGPETANMRPKTANMGAETANMGAETANMSPGTANMGVGTVNVETETAKLGPETASMLFCCWIVVVSGFCTVRMVPKHPTNNKKQEHHLTPENC